MKKTVLSLISVLTALTMIMPVFAIEKTKEEMPILISPNLENDKLISKIMVNDEEVLLGNLKMWIENEQIMIPIRLIGEKLKFEVTWNNDDESVYLDNGTSNTTLKIGVDSYFKKSSKDIGLTKSFEFGVAPVLVDGSTYVPVKLFSLLYSDDSIIDVKDGVLSIHSKNNIQIPSPIVKYDTIDKAKECLKIDIKLPSLLPNSCCDLESISVIADELLQLEYVGEEDAFIFRTAKTDKNISGDFNQYKIKKEVAINDLKVVLQGYTNIINSAYWNEKEMSYSIYSEKGLTEKDILLIISNIK